MTGIMTAANATALPIAAAISRRRLRVAGDLLTGAAGQAIWVGGGWVERGQLVVDGQHGVPVPRGAVFANLLLQLLNLLPVLRRGPFGSLAGLAVSVQLRDGRSSRPGGRGGRLHLRDGPVQHRQQPSKIEIEAANDLQFWRLLLPFRGSWGS